MESFGFCWRLFAPFVGRWTLQSLHQHLLAHDFTQKNLIPTPLPHVFVTGVTEILSTMKKIRRTSTAFDCHPVVHFNVNGIGSEGGHVFPFELHTLWCCLDFVRLHTGIDAKTVQATKGHTQTVDLLGCCLCRESSFQDSPSLNQHTKRTLNVNPQM